MAVAVYEQETTINFMRDGNLAIIYTSDSTMITKLDKLCKTSDYYVLKEVSGVDGEIIGKTYICTDKSLVSLRSTKVKREMTEEQKQAAAVRLAKAREERNK